MDEDLVIPQLFPFLSFMPSQLLYYSIYVKQYLSIIGRGRAKYHDLSVASRSIICRCRRQRQIIDLRATDKSRYFARSPPIIVLLFTYKASLYLSLKLTSFIHKLYFLKNYLITSSTLIFPACKYCRKTLTAVLVAFLYSLSFFSVVNKTTRLLIRKTSRHCLQKVEAMRMLRLLFVGEQRF